MWAASEEAGTVTPIDPRANAPLAAINVGHGPGALAVGEGAVWVVNRSDGTVSRIDPRSKAVTGLVDRLEEGNIVHRQRESTDRRVVQVVLNERGHEFARAFLGEFTAKATWLLQVLEEEDRLALFRILERIKDRLVLTETAANAGEGR